MPNPPSLPDPTQSRYENGHGSRVNGSLDNRVPPASGKGMPSFLAPFLGAFAAVFVIALVGLIGYFGFTALHSTSSLPSLPAKSKNLLMDVSSWTTGSDTAKNLDGNDQTDIGWWARTFDLPKQDAVAAYLQKQGLTVSRIEPAHYESNNDGTTITYNVYAEVPTQLMHLQQTTWQPGDQDMERFQQVLVLNDGLPAGQMWNTQNATVAADAGTKLNFAWQVHWDKIYNVVDTDQLPLSAGVFTPDQVSQFQSEANTTIAQLQSLIQQINARVASDTQAQLAQVAPDPPRPELVSSSWGGDGSGEPTKSAERIGGGALAGAAGGAAFGAAAGDAGLGAGIGAGVGLLGGLIYDGVSKSNDRKRHERAVEAENDERLDNWHSQLKALRQQRARIVQNGQQERDRALSDLENQIAANKGHLDGIATPTFAPAETPITPTSDAPPVQPTPDTPSGPVRQP